MRKLLRSILRSKAEKMGVKPSRYVRTEFDEYQSKKYGRVVRKLNQVKGTHKRKTWKYRILLEDI